MFLVCAFRFTRKACPAPVLLHTKNILLAILLWSSYQWLPDAFCYAIMKPIYMLPHDRDVYFIPDEMLKKKELIYASINKVRPYYRCNNYVVK